MRRIEFGDLDLRQNFSDVIARCARYHAIVRGAEIERGDTDTSQSFRDVDGGYGFQPRLQSFLRNDGADSAELCPQTRRVVFAEQVSVLNERWKADRRKRFQDGGR